MGATALVSVLVALVCAVFAWRADRFAKRLAKVQKVFESAHTVLSLFGRPEVEHLIIAAPLRKNTVLATELEIDVSNENIALEEAQLVIRANKELSYGDAVDKKPFPLKQAYGTTYVQDDEEMRSFIHKVEQPFYARLTLTVRTSITLLSATRIRNTLDVQAKDKLVKVSYAAHLSWMIDVILCSKSEKPIAKRIYLSVIDTNSEEPRSVLGAITQKDLECEGYTEKIVPFLYAEIATDEIVQGSHKRIYTAKIKRERLKIGFFDDQGGEIMETTSSGAPRRHAVEKAIWLYTHGYRPKT